MGVQVIIDAIGKSHTELLEPRRTALIGGYGLFTSHIEAGAQVAVKHFLTFHLGQAANSPDIVTLYPVKIIFTLGIQQAEHGIGIGLAIDMRHPVVIAVYLYIGGSLLPAAELIGRLLAATGSDKQ